MESRQAKGAGLAPRWPPRVSIPGTGVAVDGHAYEVGDGRRGGGDAVADEAAIRQRLQDIAALRVRR